jgi:hypothetical protein
MYSKLNRKDKVMKRFSIFFGLIISASVLFAQGNGENSALTKKERRDVEYEKEFQQIKSMLKNKNFVLLADYLQDQYGNRVFVSSIINFVAVDSTEATIQIGSNFRNGPNGVGGVTAKGTITKWELTEDQKNKAFTLDMNVTTMIGIYDLSIDIGASGKSSAILTGTTMGSLTFDGNLVPWQKNTVFVGQHL